MSEQKDSGLLVGCFTLGGILLVSAAFLARDYFDSQKLQRSPLPSQERHRVILEPKVHILPVNIQTVKERAVSPIVIVQPVRVHSGTHDTAHSPQVKRATEGYKKALNKPEQESKPEEGKPFPVAR